MPFSRRKEACSPPIRKFVLWCVFSTPWQMDTRTEAANLQFVVYILRKLLDVQPDRPPDVTQNETLRAGLVSVKTHWALCCTNTPPPHRPRVCVRVGVCFTKALSPVPSINHRDGGLSSLIWADSTSTSWSSDAATYTSTHNTHIHTQVNKGIKGGFVSLLVWYIKLFQHKGWILCHFGSDSHKSCFKQRDLQLLWSFLNHSKVPVIWHQAAVRAQLWPHAMMSNQKNKTIWNCLLSCTF